MTDTPEKPREPWRPRLAPLPPDTGRAALERELAAWRPRVAADLPAGLERIPMRDYHQRPGLGRSTLDKIIKSPRHLQHYLRHGSPDTPSFARGRALHAAILEPETFWESYAVSPAAKNKGAGRSAWYRFEREALGKIHLTDKKAAVLAAMVASFRDNMDAAALLDGALIEASAFWEKSGLLCKARPDISFLANGTLYDFKSASDVTYDGIVNAVKKWGYHRQAAWYMDGVSAATGTLVKDFALVVMEKSAPYDVVVYYLGGETIAAGRADNELNFAQYKRCVDTGRWPGIQGGVLSLPPRWT